VDDRVPITKRGKKFFLLFIACNGKHTFTTLTEDGTLGVQKEDGHNNSFSLGKDHDSALEVTGREGIHVLFWYDIWLP
jgi:hypothetical protein